MKRTCRADESRRRKEITTSRVEIVETKTLHRVAAVATTMIAARISTEYGSEMRRAAGGTADRLVVQRVARE